jgi:sugar O-acyltransferase (sialic acid O-acetyltransferase NeuD family)
MENPVIIFGAKGLGKVALEIFKSNNVVVYCFLDDEQELHNKEIDDVIIMGSTDDDGYLKLIGKKCEAFVALDENKVRKSLVKMLHERRHVQPINAIHQQAYIAPTAQISHGTLINAGVVINTEAKIGNHCIIHTNATVDFEVILGDFVQVGAGSIIGGGAEIADEVFIGSGVTIVPGVKIGKGARIGAGSVIVENVDAKATMFGNPAKKVG